MTIQLNDINMIKETFVKELEKKLIRITNPNDINAFLIDRIFRVKTRKV